MEICYFCKWDLVLNTASKNITLYFHDVYYLYPGVIVVIKTEI